MVEPIMDWNMQYSKQEVCLKRAQESIWDLSSFSGRGGPIQCRFSDGNQIIIVIDTKNKWELQGKSIAKIRVSKPTLAILFWM